MENIVNSRVLGGTLGLCYAIYQKTSYIAVTTFVLEEAESGGGLGQYMGLAAVAGIDIGQASSGLFHGDNIIELYKSRSMLQEALLSTAKFDSGQQLIIERFLEFTGKRRQWQNNKKMEDLSFADPTKFSRLHDSVINEVVKDINKNFLVITRPDKKLSILRVEVSAQDQEFAKVFNEQVVNTVNKFYVETKTKKSRQNVRILQRQVDSINTVMRGAIYSAAAALDATPNLNPTRQVLRTGVQRSQYTAETNKTILGELVKNLELTKMSLLRETPLIQVVDHPVLPLEGRKLGKVKGLILGAIMFQFLFCIWLTLKKIYNNNIK